MEATVLTFQCAIETCHNLRLGVLVNIVFLLLGCILVILMIIALESQPEIRDKVRKEVVAQLVHSGYSLYLIAGSAYFGAMTFSDDKFKSYLFAVSWCFCLLGLLALIENCPTLPIEN